MGLLDFVQGFTDDEFQTLIEGLTFGRIGPEREERLRELIEEADPTVRELALEEQPALNDIEVALGLEPTETAPSPEEVQEAEIQQRTPSERQAFNAVRDLIRANEEDPEMLVAIATALEEQDASGTELLTQERIEALLETDREELATEAARAARMAEDVEMEDFPSLFEVTARRGGRDAVFFRNVRRELQGEQAPETIERSGGEEAVEQLDEVREFHPDVLRDFVERVRNNIRALEGEGERGGGPSPPGISTDDVFRRGVSSRVRQMVPDEERREDPITGETFRADPSLEASFLTWVINDVKGDTDRFKRLYFEKAPANRDISMENWAQLQIDAGNSTVDEAIAAGLPRDWFEGM